MRKKLNRKLIVILGPTASGKSDLAVKIAKKLNGEVISADSRQVYKGLNVGSGKITKKEMEGIPHHLLDIANPKRTFTVAEYQKLGRRIIENIWHRDKLPILCGGTGLYVRAVVDGLVIPEVKPDLKLRKKLEKKSKEELFQILKKKDPRRAREIDPQNPRRLIRALEIVQKLGKVPNLKLNPLKAKILMIGIKRNGKDLKNLIKKRLLKRLRSGMIREVQKLHDLGLSFKKLDSFGLEYRYLSLFLQKKISKNQMIEKLNTEIWRYSKRQITWFKKDKRIVWINSKDEIKKHLKNF